MSTEQSRVLTLVFTDLADSTALKTARGDVAVGDLIARHREHVTRLAQECAGRVIDWAGDGCFLTFETSSAGVMFALRLQQVHADDPDLPGVRVGIHMGEVTEKPNPEGYESHPIVEGLAVDIAARISALAKPGQILMSSAVHASARQRLGVDALGKPILWQAHGTYELKGFDQPVDIGEAGLEGFAPLEAPRSAEKARLIRRAKRQKVARAADRRTPAGTGKWLALVALVVVIGIVAYMLGSRQTTPQQDGPIPSENIADAGPIASLAVLPLDNLSNNPDEDYFADGMTEAITAELAKIGDLKIISRTSVMRYKGTTMSVPEIASELGVQGIVEGSVLRDGDDVRITVQLIDGVTDEHLWAESYTNTITSVLKLQAEVALAIAGEINATVSPELEVGYANAPEIENVGAYETYLKGISALGNYSPEGVMRATELYEQAIEMAPEFAPAWGGLAQATVVRANWGLSEVAELWPASLTYARTALELDPNQVQALSALVFYEMVVNHDWARAREYSDRAIALNPNSGYAYMGRAALHSYLGDFDEAQRLCRKVLELDPTSGFLAPTAILVLWSAGAEDEAIGLIDSVIEDKMDHAAAMMMVATIMNTPENAPRGLEAIERGIASSSGHPFAVVRKVRLLATAGRTDEARELLESLKRSTEPELFIYAGAPDAYVDFGDLDAAFALLEEVFETPTVLLPITLRVTPYSPTAINDPNFIAFRNDPRYWAMIERVGFPPLPPEHPGYAEQQAWLARKAEMEAANAPIKKIAVLPFDNLSTDPEQEFFTDAMTEALIAELAKIRSLKVISRTSVMRYKGVEMPLTEIADELDVDAVVEGSVFKAGESVRITAQLIRGATDEHLWTASRTASLENVLQLQAEVALSMADEINAAVTPDERARIASARPMNSRAYELYVEGRAFWHERTAESFDKAEDRFERALELESNFALAQIALADVYMQRADYCLVSPGEAYEKAARLIENVLEQGDPPGEAYTSRARLKSLRDWDWAGAEADFQRALELNPADSSAHLWYAVVLQALGRNESSFRHSEIATELDPFSPVIVSRHLEELVDAGMSEEAIQYARELMLEFPDSSRVADSLAYAYEKLGRCDEAVAAARRQNALRGGDLLGTLVETYYRARCGDLDAARAFLEVDIQRAYDLKTGAVEIAEIFAIFGDVESALEWLERAVEWKDPHIGWLSRSDDFALVADEPRFQAVCDIVGLPNRFKQQ